jgi:tripartite-type tricarboxylate transporter receptor subunit TctC
MDYMILKWNGNMKYLFLFLSFLFIQNSYSQENITIYSPYSPGHSGHPAMMKIIETANIIQKDFKFQLVFKPGGEQILAVKEMDRNPENSLAIIAPKFVEHLQSSKLNKNDYSPIYALGDACWALISNLGDAEQGVSSLKGVPEVLVGGVGIGNAAHLTALQLSEKFDFKVRYIVFKSNFDALILMAGQGSINLVLERISNYENLKVKFPNIKILGLSCPIKHSLYPQIKTLKEQGIEAPYVFNIVIANKQMKVSKSNNISDILIQATKLVGAEEIQRLSDMIPPIFSNVDTEKYYNDSINLVEKLLKHHQRSIEIKTTEN